MFQAWGKIQLGLFLGLADEPVMETQVEEIFIQYQSKSTNNSISKKSFPSYLFLSFINEYVNHIHFSILN